LLSLSNYFFLHRCILLLDNRYETFNLSPLSQYKKDLKLLASHRVSIRKKRAHLVRQGGGFLSLILPAIASALFGLLGNVISKKVF